MNEVIQNMLTRKSIRTYKKDQVKDEDLKDIIQAAIYAPSGGNSQSWIFTVLQNNDRLAELNDQVKETYKNIEVNEKTYRSIVAGKNAAKNAGYSFYYHAPTLILVSNAREYPNAMADCSVAIENMMLAAHSLGLSSCWINQLTWFGDIPDIRKLLSGYGVPDDYMVCGSVALGYSENDSGKLVPRKEPNVTIIK